jgi:O-acetyl-ADP-ribose deacetylase (regulator of RNase III)
LDLAAGHGAVSVALPAISAGIYGYLLPEAATVGLWPSAITSSGDDDPARDLRPLLADTFEAFAAALAGLESPS